MSQFHKNSTMIFSLQRSGFQMFKARVREELQTMSIINLEDVIDDDSLYAIYRNGESADYVVSCICGFCEVEELADVG